jgi:hypothetical protein
MTDRFRAAAGSDFYLLAVYNGYRPSRLSSCIDEGPHPFETFSGISASVCAAFWASLASRASSTRYTRLVGRSGVSHQPPEGSALEHVASVTQAVIGN